MNTGGALLTLARDQPPGFGQSVEGIMPIKEGNGALFAVCGVVVLVAVASGGGGASEPDPAPSPTATAAPAPTGPSNAYRMMQAETEVKGRLRDPSSAEFTGMYVRNEVVCGYVNSRNGFGGMTGPQPFVSRMGVITALADDVEGDGFRETWDRVC